MACYSSHEEPGLSAQDCSRRSIPTSRRAILRPRKNRYKYFFAAAADWMVDLCEGARFFLPQARQCFKPLEHDQAEGFLTIIKQSLSL